MVWALMFTVFFGSILPDADTMASRSRFWIVSTVTMVPVSPRLREVRRRAAAGQQQHDDDQNPLLPKHDAPLVSQQSTVDSSEFQNPPSTANTAATIAATPT